MFPHANAILRKRLRTRLLCQGLWNNFFHIVKSDRYSNSGELSVLKGNHFKDCANLYTILGVFIVSMLFRNTVDIDCFAEKMVCMDFDQYLHF